MTLIRVMQYAWQEDKLAASREIFESFLENFKKVYIVSEYCTLDEQLVPFRGRPSFRIYTRLNMA